MKLNKNRFFVLLICLCFCFGLIALLSTVKAQSSTIIYSSTIGNGYTSSHSLAYSMPTVDMYQGGATGIIFEPATSAYLTDASFHLNVTGSPNFILQAALINITNFSTVKAFYISGTTPNYPIIELSSNTISSTTITGSFTWYNFTFAGDQYLSASENSAIVVLVSSTGYVSGSISNRVNFYEIDAGGGIGYNVIIQDYDNWYSNGAYEMLDAQVFGSVPTPTSTPTSAPISGGFAVTWTYGNTPIIVSGSGGIQYFFRFDTYVTLGVSGYGFDSDYGNTAQSINETYAGTNAVTFGFQAFLFSSPSVYTELTSGPSATFTINSNYVGQDNGTYNIPATSVTLGYQALQINVLESYNGGAWVTVANFISPVLITNSIKASTWTFTLYVTNTQSGGNTYTTFTFGDTTYRSGVSGIQFSKPLQSDIAMWRLSRGDYVGWIIGEFGDEISVSGFLGLLLFGFCSSLYMRYRSFGTIAWLFTAMGGGSGLIWFLLLPWGAAVGSAVIIIGMAFICWRVLR